MILLIPKIKLILCYYIISCAVLINTIYCFFSFLPTRENKEMWRLKKEVDMLIMEMIHDREIKNQNKDDEKQTDLLQKILEGAACDTTLNANAKGIFKAKHNMNQLIIDLCKNIFFAGSESTAIAVSWTLLLLALHPEWQQRVRSEILDTFDKKMPHSFSDMRKLQKLKVVSSSLHQFLRCVDNVLILFFFCS